MKKATLLALSSVAALYATTITVPTGWSLLGAINGINPSQISCANTVWTYNSGNWNLYVKNPPSTVTNNYGFNPISSINMGQGFWVNNTSGGPCYLDFSATTPTTPISYNAFGYTFTDRKSDATYTVSNTLGTNNVVFNNSSTAPLFTLNAYKSDNNDSKAGLLFAGLNDTNQLSSVDAKLKLVTGTTEYNKAQLNAGRFAITGDTVNVGQAGIVLNTNGVFVFFEKRDATTSNLVETLLASKKINTTNMVGKTVDARISVNGSTISYNITGDVNASDTFTPSTLTLASGIRYAEVRARNDDTSANTAGNESGSLTTVEFSAMGVLPYNADINATPVTTLNFADLSSFVMIDGTQSYSKITKNSANFSGADYENNDGVWYTDTSMTFAGTVNGNQVKLPNGAVYEFTILGTQKINSFAGMTFTDLYVSQATTKVITAATEYEYDTWDWANPSYYSPTMNATVPITDKNSLIAAFTTGDSQGGGIHFGDSEKPMFLVQTSTSGTRSGNVVLGQYTGATYNNCTSGDCRVVVRTSTVVGTWSEGTNSINVETPNASLTFEVVANASGYAIEQGEKEKVGAVWNEIIFSGTNATDAVIQTYLQNL